MDLMLLRMFQRETLEQSAYALIAADLLNQQISASSYDDLFWREVQNFIVSTANISKLLWGQGGKLANERQSLRDSIEVSDSSPLKPPNIMRNHFEHIDERLDRWWKESSNHNIASHSVGPPSMIAGLTTVELFRAYDPTTGIARFWGDTYNLKEIADEVNRIYPQLQTEAAKPHWKE